MKIRKLVKKINQSLGENPADWNYHNQFPETSLRNSRGMDILGGIRPYVVCIRDKWDHSTQMFWLNAREIDYLSPQFTRLAKAPSKKNLNKINKRRAWLVKEVLKTL